MEGMKQRIGIGLASAVMAVGAVAFEANYDEAKIAGYELPDPLVADDGTRVESAGQWQSSRRGELLAEFSREMFGVMPGAPDGIAWEVFEESGDAIGGKAKRRQVRLWFSKEKKGPAVEVLIYTPSETKGVVPAFLGLNFGGNHTVSDDPAVKLPETWQRPGKDGVVDNKATEKGRGKAKGRWQVEKILEQGFGLVTVYYGDIDPDFDDGFKNGVHVLYPELQGRGDNWTSIGGWSWGLSRVLDYLEKEDAVDAKKVAVLGHSRLGKTSLWAGATDERFSVVISNNSGCGGAALSRRAFGETVGRINTSFPHWFCGNYKQYNENEGAAGFDQHELIALVAPRPVYVASAEGDRWADPRGEFLSAREAGVVYGLFGMKGVGVVDWPGVHEPVGERVGYHVRAGKHDVTAYDWERYLEFCGKHWGR